MSEFYTLSTPELSPEQEKIFAHAMSPSWSRASTTSRKHAKEHKAEAKADEKAAADQHHRSLLKKLNKIFS